MKPDAFLRDLERVPEALRELAASLDDGEPWPVAGERIVMLGMGSSRFAAGVVATRMRASGLDAVAEYASLVTGTPPGPGVLAVGISASGGTEETIEALARHRGSSRTVALTNRSGSAIERAADAVVPMLAGDEEGGVACRSFRHTLALLLALEASATGIRRRGRRRRRAPGRRGERGPARPAATSGCRRSRTCWARGRPRSRSRPPSGCRRPSRPR